MHFIGCIYGRTYFQKLFFLIENELFKNLKFDFIKYHYGPFSRELNNLINNMVAEGIIEEHINVTKGMNIGHSYELTPDAEHILKKILINYDGNRIQKLKKFCEVYKHYTPSELLKLVYLKYPEWTKNSLLKG